jgi:PAS domain S-box-containing protein
MTKGSALLQPAVFAVAEAPMSVQRERPVAERRDDQVLPFRTRSAAFHVVPRTLRGRLAATYALIVAAAIIGFGLVLSQSMRSIYIDGLARGLEREARLVAELVKPEVAAGGILAGADSVVERAATAVEGRITVYAPDGTVIGDSSVNRLLLEQPPARVEHQRALREGVYRSETDGPDAKDGYLFVSVASPDVAGMVIRVGMPLDEVDQTIRTLQDIVFVAGLVSAALAAVVGIGVAGRIAGPLEDLRRQASVVAQGRLDASVQPSTTHELGELGQAFNTMTKRLGASLREAELARGRLEATLANLTDGVVITDGRGWVLRSNRAALEMLGASSQRRDQPFIEIGRDHELDSLLRRALAGADDARVEGSVMHARSRRMLEAKAQRLEAGGEVLGLMVLRDVTELRRLEGVRASS